MTIDDRTAAVIRQLTERTEAGRLEWRWAGSEQVGCETLPGEFRTDLPLPDGDAVRWEVELLEGAGGPDVLALTVTRLPGASARREAILFQAVVEDGAVGRQDRFDLLRRLYDAAQRSTARWDETLDQMETVLSGR